MRRYVLAAAAQVPYWDQLVDEVRSQATSDIQRINAHHLRGWAPAWGDSRARRDRFRRRSRKIWHVDTDQPGPPVRFLQPDGSQGNIKGMNVKQFTSAAAERAT